MSLYERRDDNSSSVVSSKVLPNSFRTILSGLLDSLSCSLRHCILFSLGFTFSLVLLSYMLSVLFKTHFLKRIDMWDSCHPSRFRLINDSHKSHEKRLYWIKLKVHVLQYRFLSLFCWRSWTLSLSLSPFLLDPCLESKGYSSSWPFFTQRTEGETKGYSGTYFTRSFVLSHSLSPWKSGVREYQGPLNSWSFLMSSWSKILPFFSLYSQFPVLRIYRYNSPLPVFLSQTIFFSASIFFSSCLT